MKNKKLLYVLLAFVAIAVNIGLGFLFNTFWPFASKQAFVCYWVIKGTSLAGFISVAMVAIFGKGNRSLTALALAFSAGLLVYSLIVRLLLLIPVAGVTICWILTVLVFASIIISILMLGVYSNHIKETDTQIQTEYKKTNYEQYKEAQANIEKQKQEEK